MIINRPRLGPDDAKNHTVPASRRDPDRFEPNIEASDQVRRRTVTGREGMIGISHPMQTTAGAARSSARGVRA